MLRSQPVTKNRVFDGIHPEGLPVRTSFASVCLLIVCATFLVAASPNDSKPSTPASWSESAAARYLDSRQVWWQSWPNAKRDHETVCVSCHTVLPYALSRRLLHPGLDEHAPAAPEQVLLDNLKKRVSLWNEVEPYYLDKSGPGKAVESRATESVLNALVLSSYDAQQGQLSDSTRTALNSAWALQLKTGEKAGAWNWQVFHLAPWESDESQYQGATFMALAVGFAPESYRKDPAVQGNLHLLRSYLKREYAAQPLENQIVLLWASARFSGLLTSAEQTSLVDALYHAQHQDGGWSLSDLGPWKRRDDAPLATASDGYATGLIVLALRESGTKRETPQLKNGIAWLESNQNKTEGSWQAFSVNKNRDLTTDVGRFMSDAATGYAVMALENSR